MAETAYSQFYGTQNVSRTMRKVGELHAMDFEQLVGNRLEHNGSCHVLDIGSGNSSFTIELARRYPAATFFTIDVCSDEQRGFDPRRRPPNVIFDIQDGNAMQFPNDTFDVVTATWSVSKYLPEDFATRPTTYITEIARVLRPGGIATIRPELAVSNHHLLDTVLEKLQEADYPNRDKIARKVTDYQLLETMGVSVQFLEDPNRARITRYA